MTELGTIIKQVNKETFLDLSKTDLHQDNFVKDFRKFTKEKAQFLSGTSLSLILPDNFQDDDEKLVEVLDKVQKELNKRNISLKQSNKNFQDNQPEGEITESQEPEQLAQRPQAEELPSDLRAMLGRSNVLYIKSNLRSGQAVQHPGDVVVFGDVNHSAEILASGDIIVWGRLRGVVHAGAEGDDKAVIAALNIDCGQLRISDKLLAISSAPTKRTKAAPNFVPEIAKIVDNEIRVLEFAQQ